MWKTLFDSSFLGKALLGLLVCAVFYFMQIRLTHTQAELAQKEEQCLLLQNANKKQQENIAKFVQEQKKQEELILQAEQERQKLLEKSQAKQATLHKSTDTASTNWKNTPLPETILQILREEK